MDEGHCASFNHSFGATFTSLSVGGMLGQSSDLSYSQLMPFSDDEESFAEDIELVSDSETKEDQEMRNLIDNAT